MEIAAQNCFFNQNVSRFALIVPSGILIYSISPFQEYSRVTFPVTSESQGTNIRIVEMLFNSNIIALVGKEPKPRFPINKVVLWNVKRGRIAGEIPVKSPVLAVKLSRNFIAIGLQNSVRVHRFSNLQLLKEIGTVSNNSGILSLSPDNMVGVMATVGTAQGIVQVHLLDIDKELNIHAHNSSIAQLELSSDGLLLATASEKGTVIKIFNSHSGYQLRELRRGRDNVKIFSLAFNATNTFIACSSSSGTVHIFACTREMEEEQDYLVTRLQQNDHSDDGLPGDARAVATISGGGGGSGLPGGSGGGGGGGGGLGFGDVTPGGAIGITRVAPPPAPATAASTAASNKGLSAVSLLLGVLPQAAVVIPDYAQSEWSYAQMHNTCEPGMRASCCFDRTSDGHIVVVNSAGLCLVGSFEKGGECVVKSSNTITTC